MLLINVKIVTFTIANSYNYFIRHNYVLFPIGLHCFLNRMVYLNVKYVIATLKLSIFAIYHIHFSNDSLRGRGPLFDVSPWATAWETLR